MGVGELTFRMSLFISMMKAERKGGHDADAAVRPHVFSTTCSTLFRVCAYCVPAAWSVSACSGERFFFPFIFGFLFTMVISSLALVGPQACFRARTA